MNRYPIRPQRAHLLLDGCWSFAYLGEVDVMSVTPRSVCCPEIAAVPGCYDTAGETIGKRGVAVYQTRFAFSAGAARLVIGGLGLYARIFLDDTLIREVKTPYATVAQQVCCSGEEQTLTIVLDNRFDEERVPLFKGFYDFYGYGGIYRSVRLESLPEVAIDRAVISTRNLAIGLVRVQIKLAGNVPTKVRLQYRFDQGNETELELPVADGQAVFEAQVPQARIWSPVAPGLHLLRVRVGSDAIIERFGLRTIATQGQEILLNGEVLRLHGVNRHEAHPEFGPVQPAQLMADDLKWVKELGANFIRGAHYQQNPEFLEMCDEAGILVWNESLAWGLTDRESDREETVRLLEESTAIMAAECVNNPAVIFCGFLNECNTDTPSGRSMHRKMAQAVRAYNPNCLVSYAGNRFGGDACTDLVDVISVNPYPGWISHIEDVITDYRAGIKPAFDQVARSFSQPQYGDKPLLVSEAGACGLYGVRDRARAQWSEEFQADYFAAVIPAVMENSRFCGITLWQMIDCRSFVNAGQIRTKPRGYNCAGLLDEYRRPKLAFDEVKRLFHSLRRSGRCPV